MGLLHHPFWLRLVFRLFGHQFQPFVNYFVWLRITDEGSVPEMRIWSILLIKSDLKWCILLRRSLFLYFNTWFREHWKWAHFPFSRELKDLPACFFIRTSFLKSSNNLELICNNVNIRCSWLVICRIISVTSSFTVWGIHTTSRNLKTWK